MSFHPWKYDRHQSEVNPEGFDREVLDMPCQRMAERNFTPVFFNTMKDIRVVFCTPLEQNILDLQQKYVPGK